MENVMLVLYYFGFRRLAGELLRRLGKSSDAVTLWERQWYGCRLWKTVSFVRVLIPALIVVALLVWLEASFEVFGLTAIAIPIMVFVFQLSLSLRPFNLKEFAIVLFLGIVAWILLAAVLIFHLQLTLPL